MKIIIRLENEASYQNVVLIQVPSFLSIWIPNASLADIGYNFTPENCRVITVTEEWTDEHGQQQTRTRTIEGYTELQYVQVDPKDRAAYFVKLVRE